MNTHADISNSALRRLIQQLDDRPARVPGRDSDRLAQRLRRSQQSKLRRRIAPA